MRRGWPRARAGDVRFVPHAIPFAIHSKTLAIGRAPRLVGDEMPAARWDLCGLRDVRACVPFEFTGFDHSTAVGVGVIAWAVFLWALA